MRRISGVIGDKTRQWTERDVTTCAGTLCAAALAGARGASGKASRALHALLDRRAEAEHVRALVAPLRHAAPNASTRLRLASLLRSGGRGGADALADALIADALVHALRAPHAEVEPHRGAADPQEAESSPARALSALEGGAPAWRAMSGAQRYAALQLAGRALAACPPPLRARPLRALAALVQPPSAKEKHQPDHLKVGTTVLSAFSLAPARQRWSVAPGDRGRRAIVSGSFRRWTWVRLRCSSCSARTGPRDGSTASPTALPRLLYFVNIRYFVKQLSLFFILRVPFQLMDKCYIPAE